MGHPVIALLARLLRTRRAVEEDRGDLQADSAARRSVELDDELDDIEEDEEEE